MYVSIETGNAPRQIHRQCISTIEKQRVLNAKWRSKPAKLI